MMMRIHTNQEMNMVKAAVMQLSGSAIIVNTRTNREYDLHSEADRNEVFRLLRTNFSDNLELFVSKREDTEIMMGLMDRLSHPVNQPADSIESGSPKAA